jgi:hypothetical protein
MDVVARCEMCLGSPPAQVLVGLPPLCAGCYRVPKIRNPTQGAEKSLNYWMAKYGIDMSDLRRHYRQGLSEWMRMTLDGRTKKSIENSRSATTQREQSAQR